MVAIASSSSDGSLDDVLETLELALEAIDGLRGDPDERPDRLLAELGRLHRRVEEIAEASWRRAEDDRLDGALDAIDRLRIRVDDADPTETVHRTLDLVSSVAARLDGEDSMALAELTLEAVEAMHRRIGEDGESARVVLGRAVAGLDRLRLEVEARDPADAIELALEAMDDVGRRVDARAAAVERRLATLESSLTVLTDLAAGLGARMAESAPLDEARVAFIADRVAEALIARMERMLDGAGRVETTTAALPSNDQHAAVMASAAAAMARMEGRLDSEFGAVERSVDRLDRHLAELEELMRGETENGRRPGLRWRGRAARR
jgi:hypothetical protein